MTSLPSPTHTQYAIITGSAGGIGKQLVKTFSRNGYQVIAIDVSRQPNDMHCWQYLQVDLQQFVINPTYTDVITGKLLALLSDGNLDVLINNAAVQILGGVETLSLDDWHTTLNVNLLAPFKLTQRLLPLIEMGKGCVINMSSIHARLTKANFVSYATSKAALSGLTRAMAVDLGGRIRVNAIEPAAVATEMLAAGFADQPDRYAELEACHPQGRLGSPAEIAALALAITSGDLRFLHGACIGIDGGISGRLHDPY